MGRMSNAEMIQILQDKENGKEIQYRRYIFTDGEWVTTDRPVWNFHEYAFRVKPNKIYQYTLPSGDASFEGDFDNIEKYELGVYEDNPNRRIVFLRNMLKEALKELAKLTN